ncbi:MAG: STAS domain-containing protein [Candidatus Riflebacteria bacterium]|nr:STAS domain-containing protein [Candidatus Riflebacteria bacterium]
MSEIRLEILAKGVLLVPKGYIDKAYGEAIKRKVEEQASLGRGTLVLSFVDCPIVNSTGLARLIETIELAAEKGTDLWFADLSVLQRRTFEAAGLLALVPRIVTSSEARIVLG